MDLQEVSQAICHQMKKLQDKVITFCKALGRIIYLRRSKLPLEVELMLRRKLSELQKEPTNRPRKIQKIQMQLFINSLTSLPVRVARLFVRRQKPPETVTERIERFAKLGLESSDLDEGRKGLLEEMKQYPEVLERDIIRLVNVTVAGVDLTSTLYYSDASSAYELIADALRLSSKKPLADTTVAELQYLISQQLFVPLSAKAIEDGAIPREIWVPKNTERFDSYEFVEENVIEYTSRLDEELVKADEFDVKGAETKLSSMKRVCRYNLDTHEVNFSFTLTQGNKSISWEQKHPHISELT